VNRLQQGGVDALTAALLAAAVLNFMAQYVVVFVTPFSLSRVRHEEPARVGRVLGPSLPRPGAEGLDLIRPDAKREGGLPLRASVEDSPTRNGRSRRRSRGPCRRSR
jgi:hypothetical protein